MTNPTPPLKLSTVQHFATVGEPPDVVYAAGMVVNGLRFRGLIGEDGAVGDEGLRAALNTLFGQELDDSEYLFLTKLLLEGGYRDSIGRGERITELNVAKLREEGWLV